jgi:aminopeptidase C
MCATKSGVGHASLIIGRRRDPKTGVCQYRVRNSYGADCVGKNGKSKYSPDWQCDAGNIWVDEDELMKNTVGVSYLKAP